jgi:hypothetical protein
MSTAKNRPRLVGTVACLFGLLLAGPLAAETDAAGESTEAEATPDEATGEASTDTGEPAGDKLTISADRPGASNGPSITPTGHVQFETGFSASFDELGSSYDLGTTLFRTGIVDFAEARVTVTPVSISVPEGGEADVQGLSSLTVGGKVGTELGDDAAIALRPYVTADSLLDDDIWSGGADGIFVLGTSQDVSLTGNVGLASVGRGGGDRAVEAFLAMSAGASFSDRAGAYLELYSFFSSDEQTDVFIDLGATYLVTNRIQLDAFFGFNPIDGVEGQFAGLGFSLLL